MPNTFSRRHFVGGLAATIGTLGLTTPAARRAQVPVARPARTRGRLTLDEYDAAAKLTFNENPHGPSESVARAMTTALKFQSRYNYPDGDILDEIAAHHGVKRESVLLGAGSSEILEATGRTFLPGGRKVIGVVRRALR